MRKPIEDKSPLAAWATLSRDQAQMSVEEVVDALAARGHAVQAATIRGIEGGSKGASARLRRLMAEVYGVSVPGAAPQATQTPDALVAALMAQTAALNAHTAAVTAMLEELRVGRAETEMTRQALLRAFGRAIPTDPPEGPAADVLGTPAGVR